MPNGIKTDSERRQSCLAGKVVTFTVLDPRLILILTSIYIRRVNILSSVCWHKTNGYCIGAVLLNIIIIIYYIILLIKAEIQ